MTAPRDPAPPDPARPARLLSASALAGLGVLYAVYVLVVRAEPRPGLAAGALLLVGLAGLVVAGVRPAPLLAVPVGIAVVERLGVYVPFSLERPDEPGAIAYSAVALAVAGVAVVSGVVATAMTYGVRLRGGAAISLAGGLVLALAAGLVLRGQAQPDQAGTLTATEREALPRVVMDDYRYAPSMLTAEAGQELALLLVNDDTETYRFVVDELGVDVVVPSARQAVVRLIAPEAGSLEFYSSEEDGEHRALGMVGTLVVSAA